MGLRRSTCRNAALATVAVGLLAGTIMVATQAQAQVKPVTPDGVRALAAQLAERSAGSYLDETTGKMVVTITDSAAAAQVRAAGAVPRLVKHSTAQLDQATTTLGSAARVAGSAWAIDPATNQVVISLDASVSGAKLAQVQAVAARLGDAVRVERVAGTFSVRAAGGDAIYGGQYRCSLGFNVRSGSTYYFLTAGHCGNVVSTWYSNSAKTSKLGNTVSSNFPGHDYALVKYTTSTTPPGSVDLYGGTQDITSAGSAYVGETVTRSGSTSGVHSGRVTQLNATVNYAEGSVSGLIRTTVCAEPGDSGGALFAGTTALGLTSGGSGNCSSGGVTYFQPVTAALSAYGVSVY